MRKKAGLFDANAIGRRVRELRKSKHLNQEALAERCQLSTSLIGHIERGEKAPSLSTIILLSSVFNVSLDALVLGRSDVVCDQSHCPLYADLSRLIEKYDCYRNSIEIDY